MTTEGHDATTTSAGTGGDGADLSAGGLAAPGEDLSTPSGTPAGPAPDEADDTEAAEGVRRFATVEWQMPFWGREAGESERLELTDTVQGAVNNGKLKILDEIETVPAARRPARRRG